MKHKIQALVVFALVFLALGIMGASIFEAGLERGVRAGYEAGHNAYYKEYRSRFALDVDGSQEDEIIFLSIHLMQQGLIVVPKDQWLTMYERRK